jgi:hypothetical protein
MHITAGLSVKLIAITIMVALLASPAMQPQFVFSLEQRGEPNHTIAKAPIQSATSAPGLALKVTVGTDPDENACGKNASITVPAGTIVYFCYTVTNTGTSNFTFHNVSDDIHGAMLIDFSYALMAGDSVSLTHEIYIADTPAINNAMWVASGNGGTVTATNRAIVLVDGAPSAVNLAEFSAERTPRGTKITWQTTNEDDTLGYHIYRAEGKSVLRSIPNNAIRITSDIIYSYGRNGGTYAVLDTSSNPNKTYTYWLREINVYGRDIDYAMVGNKMGQVFLPLVFKQPKYRRR